MSYLWENGLGKKLKSDFDYVTHTVMAVQVITFDMEMDSTPFNNSGWNIFGAFPEYAERAPLVFWRFGWMEDNKRK